MKIEIFGAAGSGKTTLSKSWAKKYGWTHLESEDYLWQKTDPPYQKQFSLEEKLTSLAFDFHKYENIVLCGCVEGWGSKWETAFDLVVFLEIPHDIRMKRLIKREKEEYGELLKTHDWVISNHKEFMEWAKSNDDIKNPNAEIHRYRKWIKKLNCPTLEINGDTTNEERIYLIENKLRELKKM